MFAVNSQKYTSVTFHVNNKQHAHLEISLKGVLQGGIYVNLSKL